MIESIKALLDRGITCNRRVPRSPKEKRFMEKKNAKTTGLLDR